MYSTISEYSYYSYTINYYDHKYIFAYESICARTGTQSSYFFRLFAQYINAIWFIIMEFDYLLLRIYVYLIADIDAWNDTLRIDFCFLLPIIMCHQEKKIIICFKVKLKCLPSQDFIGWKLCTGENSHSESTSNLFDI